MKKLSLLKSIIALAITVCSFAANAENYSIKVGGVAVNTANCSNITGENITSGKASYDPSTNTLTLDNTVIGNLSGICNDNCKNLKINLVGQVSISGCVYLSRSTTIAGMENSFLTVKGTSDFDCFVPLYIYGNADGPNKITLDNVNAYIEGRYLFGGSENDYHFKNCNIAGFTMRWNARPGCYGMSFDGCSIVAPAGFSLDSDGYYNVNGKPFRGGRLEIRTNSNEEYYGLSVGDVTVSSQNAGNITGRYIKSGKVSYNPTSNVLTLDHVVMGNPYLNFWGIESNIENLTIEVKGTTKMPTMLFLKSTVIQGSGSDSLIVENDNRHEASLPTAIAVDRSVLTFKGLNTVVKSGTALHGGLFDWQNLGKLVLDSCTFNASASMLYNNWSVDLSEIVMNKCGVAEGGLIDNSVKVERAVPYGLTLAGIEFNQFTNFDKENSKTGYMKGSAHFDVLMNTLNILGSKIDKEKCPVGLISKIPNLSVAMIDSVKFSSISLLCSTKIVGMDWGFIRNFTLDMPVENYGISFTDTLTLENLVGCIKAGGAIVGQGKPTDRLFMDQCDLTLDGKGKPTISNIGELDLLGCDIVSPAGAAFDPALGGVALNGKLVTSEIVIKSREYTRLGIDVFGIEFNEKFLRADSTSFIKGNSSIPNKYPIKSGSACYNPETKVLTIDNLTNNEDAGYQVVEIEKLDSIRVEIKGNVCFPLLVIGAQNAEVCGYPESLLNLEHLSYLSNFSDCNLTVENLETPKDIIFTASLNNNAQVTDLSVKRCNLKVEKADFYAPLGGFRSLTFEGCGIVEPAEWSYKNGRLQDKDGKVYTGRVIISTDGAGVESVVAEGDDDPNAPMFNVMGQRIEQPYHGQLYIQNGKKKVWFDK